MAPVPFDAWRLPTSPANSDATGITESAEIDTLGLTGLISEEHERNHEAVNRVYRREWLRHTIRENPEVRAALEALSARWNVPLAIAPLDRQILEQDRIVVDASWQSFLLQLKSPRCREDAVLHIDQPLVLSFTGKIILMKHCTGTACKTSFIYKPGAPEAELGRCFNCCAWNPGQYDVALTTLVPQFKLVCEKAGDQEVEKVIFLLPQATANVVKNRIRFSDMVLLLESDPSGRLQEFKNEMNQEMECSRLQIDKSTLIYNRAGENPIVDVEQITFIV